MVIDWHEIVLEFGRLLLAAILGGAIGFERESHGQSAGFRTNVLVCLGACLMMMLSLHIEEVFRHLTSQSAVRLDPGRIASYAIASMGFLGGGAIIKGKGSVRGLTTAAGLWLVTGIGLAVGVGFIIPSIFTTFLSLVVLYSLRAYKTSIAHDVYTLLTITLCTRKGALKEIKNILDDYSNLRVRFINYYHHVDARTSTYRFRLSSKDNLHWGEVVTRLEGLPDIKDITWEESDVP